MTGRAYMGEVPNQEISELLDKQVNAQKEKIFRSSRTSIYIGLCTYLFIDEINAMQTA